MVFRKTTSYKKRDRYKKTLEEKIEEKLNTFFENMFMVFIQNLSEEHGSPLLHLLAPWATNLSSMGSTTGLVTWYPMDDITVDMPCHLHIPLGRVGNKTKEVPTGVAMSGRVLHNNPISVEYAKVLVREITDMGYIDYPLDHVTPEGVKELGQAVNQFILWNRREFFLDGLISPQRLCVHLSQTPALSPVAHALATPPSQQEAQQLPTPPGQQEAQQLPTPPGQQEAQQLPTPLGQREAQQLPCP
jgi:hypothetical protein